MQNNFCLRKQHQLKHRGRRRRALFLITAPQCSNWYEIWDMEFSQKTEENPDPSTNQGAYFSKWKWFVYAIILWNINVSPNYFFEEFVKLHYWDLATTFMFYKMISSTKHFNLLSQALGFVGGSGFSSVFWENSMSQISYQMEPE